MHNRQPSDRPRLEAGITGKQALALLGALVLLAALAGAYYAYWRSVARQLEEGVLAWVGEQRALGNDVAFAWDGIGGFPFRFAATFRDPAIRWATPRGVIAWRGAAVRAEMAPWNLRRIAVRSNGQHDASLRLQDAPEWRVAATGLAGSITLHGGGLRGFTLALQQPDLTLPGGGVLAGAGATLMLDLPATPPADYSMPLARVALDARSVALPAGTRLLTEDPIETLTLDATIKGPMSLAPLKEALAAWRAAGGVVELGTFAFTQGPLGLGGNATLALDADLQPEGAGTVTSTGLGEAVEILVRDGLIPPDRALVARATAKALEKPGPNGRLEATIGLSLQNRTVSFGPVPLFAVPPIVWP
jgi:hypothetical protein